jgi:hypothetical protein
VVTGRSAVVGIGIIVGEIPATNHPLSRTEPTPQSMVIPGDAGIDHGNGLAPTVKPIFRCHPGRGSRWGFLSLIQLSDDLMCERGCGHLQFGQQMGDRLSGHYQTLFELLEPGFALFAGFVTKFRHRT